ncbi:DUF1493 family protein [Rouxiella sp. WC2420]|uniref:DUF1493 family protein n=1 Tax=Rouxiella sp. WC2420 TaxID=3234145 RepID=A0AB39VPC3_9GAMM
MESYNEDEVREFILGHLPKVTGLFKKVIISDDEILQETFESEDIAALVEDLSAELNVDCKHFDLLRYYPWKTKSTFNKEPDNTTKKPLSLKMFIESAKVRRWLYN